MKYLVLGSGGMLGHVACTYLREQDNEVVDFSFPGKAFSESVACDVTDLGFVSEFLDQNHFDVVINCIALLIASSEQNKAQAIFLNSYFPHWLEQRLSSCSTRIIQVGTDGVFGNTYPRNEDSPHRNDTFYARSKSLGELNNAKDITIRSSYFGPDRNREGVGLLNWFFKCSGKVSGYRRAIFSGVTSLEFAKFCSRLSSNAGGTYNLRALELIDKYSLLLKIKKLFELNSIELEPDDSIMLDTSVQTIRTDIEYKPKSYDDMLADMKEYMECHAEMYEHYDFLQRVKTDKN